MILACVLLHVVIAGICTLHFATGRHNTVKLGVLLPETGPYPFLKHKVLPAIDIAVKNVERLGYLPDHNIIINFRDDECSETMGPIRAFDLYVNKEVDVFLGPTCEYAAAPVARYASFWNLPVISAGAFSQEFDDKNEYSLLTRMLTTYGQVAEVVAKITQTFNWTKVGLLFHNNIVNGDRVKSDFFTMEAIFNKLKNGDVEPWYGMFDQYNRTFNASIPSMLQTASTNARILVLSASADSVREIMIKANELNFDNGEYVFINIDLFSSKEGSEMPWYRENDTVERNLKARRAYEALMTLTLRKQTSQAYRMFSEEVKRRTGDDSSTYGEDEVNSFVGAFHDAVILYALALNETLANNGSINNGTEITQRMWNRTFQGITGTVSIDGSGDRNADFSLLDMNPTTGKFEVVANFYGKNRKYVPVINKQIHWPGSRKSAPPDTPECGFDGAKCPPESSILF